MLYIDLPCSFTTRVHNGMFPSPTMHFRAGQQYQITLINNLEPEAPNNPQRGHCDPNTTNIHTHGLHVSGVFPGDSVFRTAHPRGSPDGSNNLTYILNVPCNQLSGTHWWHPHHHHSTVCL